MSESIIGFSYPEYVVGNMASIASGSCFAPEDVILTETMLIAERFNIQTIRENLSRATEFSHTRRLVYGVTNPVLQAVDKILDSPEYFPENPEDFKHILGNGGELNAVQKMVLDAHSELHLFWRMFSQHYHGQAMLTGALKTLGAARSRVFDDEDFPCLYHRGFKTEDIPFDVSLIVEQYKLLKNNLGFTPAMLLGNMKKLPDIDNIQLLFTDTDYMVSGITLGGRIWFEGTPMANQGPGKPTMRAV